MLLEYSVAYIVGLIAVVLVGGLYLGAHVLFWLGVVDEFDLNTTTKNTIIWKGDIKMTEKILEINEVFGVRGPEPHHDTMDGYEVVTDEQTIRMVIGNEQNCCERWGYMVTNDTPEDFIGATVTGIKITDHELGTKGLLDDIYEGQAMFIDIETDIGVLQFAIYNDHNGYYSHGVIVSSNQVNEETYL